MYKNVFISFLGKGSYSDTTYYYNSIDNSIDTKFVQLAIIEKILLEDRKIKPDDLKVLICTTKEAEESNWIKSEKIIESFSCRYKNPDDPSSIISKSIRIVKETTGLHEELQNIGIDEKNIENIRIDNGFTEDEIKQIMFKISNKIPQNADIYLDITNGYRSIPMIGLVLSNYLKTAKNTKTKGIYYGAFESPGKEKPIVELDFLSDFQDLTIGAEVFNKYGNPEKLADFFENISNNDSKIEHYKNLSKSLKQFFYIILTNRLLEINKGDVFNEINGNIEKISKKNDINYAVYEKISNKIEALLNNKSYLRFLDAAEFCKEHGLVQQGITILQEGVITYLISKYGNDNFDKICEYIAKKENKENNETKNVNKENENNKKENKISSDNIENKKCSDFVSEYKLRKLIKSKLWMLKNGKEINTETLIKKVQNTQANFFKRCAAFIILKHVENSKNNERFKSLAEHFHNLKEYRNNINHAGCDEKSNLEKEFRTQLEISIKHLL